MFYSFKTGGFIEKHIAVVVGFVGIMTVEPSAPLMVVVVVVVGGGGDGMKGEVFT